MIQLLYHTIFAEMVFIFVDIPEKSLDKRKWDDEMFYIFVIFRI